MNKVLLIHFAILGLFVSCICSQSCSLDPENAAERVDVLVLGAGMAGIAAAKTLQVNGITDFIVLEATDRLGGRIRKDDETGVELGANWIHGLDLSDKKRHPIWREWTECDDDGPDGSITPDITALYDDNGAINITQYREVEKMFQIASNKVEEMTETLSDETSLRVALCKNNWTPNSSLEHFTEWVHIDFCIAIKPENLSAKLFYSDDTYTDYLGPEDDPIDYLVTDTEGYSSVVDCMARNFKDKVKLNSAVTIIQRAEDCVCVTVQDNKQYCGDYAIVTFSIGVLQAAIHNEDTFAPQLPEEKETAINNVTLVHYGRIHLRFNAFWNNTGYCDKEQCIIGYVSDKRGRYAYYILDSNRPDTITVDVTEELAIHVESQSMSSIIKEIMPILQKVFPDYNISDPDTVTAVISNWSNDPFFRSSWTAFAPGVQDDIFNRLLEPVGRLYFAGESLNHSHYGYTHGAYGSGVFVAEQLYSKLTKSNCEIFAKHNEV